jgi:hypothetical protein
MEIFAKDSFEAWKKRPVYIAQCHTWALAARLNLTVHGFRSLPAYRGDWNQHAQAARKAVAYVIRGQRKVLSRKRAVLSQLAIVGQHNPATGYLVDVIGTLNLTVELHKLQDEIADFD